MQNFIPLVSSEAGLCLSTANWQAAKVTTLAYSLEFLLYRPGKEILKKVKNLSDYMGWTGHIVLNASSLIANREGRYNLKSPYDGSKISLEADELLDLIYHLKPQIVLLPKNTMPIGNNWPEGIIPFFHVDSLSSLEIKRAHGVYLNESMLAQLDQWRHLPRYVMGLFDPKQISSLKNQSIDYIETDEPARAAFEGRVYSCAGEIDLKTQAVQKQFTVIDPKCTCPVCDQKFTQAYFHHLLQHTPLLCQRLLIQHNVFFSESELCPP